MSIEKRIEELEKQIVEVVIPEITIVWISPSGEKREQNFKNELE